MIAIIERLQLVVAKDRRQMSGVTCLTRLIFIGPLLDGSDAVPVAYVASERVLDDRLTFDGHLSQHLHVHAARRNGNFVASVAHRYNAIILAAIDVHSNSLFIHTRPL
jgi:hypothetical protein